MLAYAFNHAEAVRSFREAARLDPDFAMTFRSEACALGPNINAPMDPGAVSPAWAAIQQALAKKVGVAEVELAAVRAVIADPAFPADLVLVNSPPARIAEIARPYPGRPDRRGTWASRPALAGLQRRKTDVEGLHIVYLDCTAAPAHP